MTAAARSGVLVASPDANFRRLAAATLREAGYTVGTSDLRPERLAGRMRVDEPDALLLEADAAATRRIRDALGARAVIIRAVEDPSRTRAPGPVVGKWWPSADLVAGIEQALRTRRTPALRLVRP